MTLASLSVLSRHGRIGVLHKGRHGNTGNNICGMEQSDFRVNPQLCHRIELVCPNRFDISIQHMRYLRDRHPTRHVA